MSSPETPFEAAVSDLVVANRILAAEGAPIWGPLPLIAGEIGVLVLLSVAALKADDRNREHHGSEGQHDAGLEKDGEHMAVDRQPEPVDDRARQS